MCGITSEMELKIDNVGRVGLLHRESNLSLLYITREIALLYITCGYIYILFIIIICGKIRTRISSATRQGLIKYKSVFVRESCSIFIIH